MAIFLASFLRPVFSASRVQHISDMHSKFALRPHHMAIHSPTTGIRRGKKEGRRKKPQGKYIMSASATHGCHNKCVSRLARHKYHHTALRYTATPNSEHPPSHGAQFQLPHCDFLIFYIAHAGSNAAAVTPHEPKFTKMAEDLSGQKSNMHAEFHAPIFFHH